MRGRNEIELQWNRTISSTETREVKVVSGTTGAASMEPYSFEYGNQPSEGYMQGNKAASMEPYSFEYGNTSEIVIVVSD